MTRTSRVDVLVVSAHAGELRGLLPHLGERLDGMLLGLHVSTKSVGVGSTAAAAAATKRIAQLEPRAVIMIGTCGVYPGIEGYQPYDIVVASKVHLIDHAVFAGRASFPEPMQAELAPAAPLSAGLAAAGPRVRRASVASPMAFTDDDAFALGVPSRTGCEVENLEAFAVAQACHLLQVPLAVVLAVTHVVGSHRKVDWQKFERHASIGAADVVVNWLHQGAQGLPAA